MSTVGRQAREQELIATAARRLERLGQRLTKGRRSLVLALSHAGHPLTIAEIVERPGNRVPQSSAYRNLALLERARIVRRIHTGDEFARYELEDDVAEHHHHLVCSNCGSITDVEAPRGLERTVHRAMGAVAAGEGFSPSGHRLDVVGLCRNCA